MGAGMSPSFFARVASRKSQLEDSTIGVLRALRDANRMLYVADTTRVSGIPARGQLLPEWALCTTTRVPCTLAPANH